MCVLKVAKIISYLDTCGVWILTDGPPRPEKPRSPRCPGRPTIPRDPAIPWGPGIPPEPCTQRHRAHLADTLMEKTYAKKTLTEHGDSQGIHQSREIPSLHRVLGLQQYQPHQGDRRFQSHHGLLLLRLCQWVRRVQGVQRLPGEDSGQWMNNKAVLEYCCWLCGLGETYRGARGSNSTGGSGETSSTLHTEQRRSLEQHYYQRV